MNHLKTECKARGNKSRMQYLVIAILLFYPIIIKRKATLFEAIFYQAYPASISHPASPDSLTAKAISLTNNQGTTSFINL